MSETLVHLKYFIPDAAYPELATDEWLAAIDERDWVECAKQDVRAWRARQAALPTDEPAGSVTMVCPR